MIAENYSGSLRIENGKRFLCSLLELYFKTWSLASLARHCILTVLAVPLEALF